MTLIRSHKFNISLKKIKKLLVLKEIKYKIHYIHKFYNLILNKKILLKILIYSTN